ncbi:hypothetical protein KVR01_013516 [Diaporthe batatas]|uniref:uncharacterized protein n=1 Tax=Diaporthe batatas TaxID=748121 RepID=UPI001D04E24E|nr:uncharacterized protein KVR01_013516 [Diaporthe batatas]KAG8156565.1 hypothetical protein KVR01_013516 [Diaporthe batatas]
MGGAAISLRGLLAVSGLALSALAGNIRTRQSENLCETAKYENKTRVFVMTDISNEPDDQMSLVRFLTYANELDIVNIAVVTSTWKNDSIDTPSTYGVIDGYRQVLGNLNSHVPEAGVYPPADEVAAKVVTGHSVYGLAALDEPTPSNASTALVAGVDASEEPLWVLAWGGANVLAEALNQVRNDRSEDEVAAFVRKLRVYSISDQDDAGAWIRTNFPTLFYIVSIHGFSEYAIATWNGISGEGLRHFDKGGPDSSLVSNEWLQEHIRIGPLGAHYLNWSYIMEGDTPSFLGLIPNGLNAPEHPEWGGWGGRYILMVSSGAQGTFSDAADWAIGVNNETYFSQFASIWRWREAYQYDFAARMQWTVNNAANSTAKPNHQPVAVVNGSCGILEIPYSFGESVVLDASESWDPDGDDLSFDWFHYREPTFRLEGDIPRISPNVTFDALDATGSVVNVTPNNNETFHIVLTVRDDQPMKLSSYKRVILRPQS